MLPKLWRINLKPDNNGQVDPRRFCLDNNILGVGWPVAKVHSGATWEQYWTDAQEDYKKFRGVHAVRRMKEVMKQNDLCWTRNLQGVYYLGRITGDWEYRDEPVYKANDILNIRKCHWVEIGLEDKVPGDVTRSFTQASLQQVYSRDALIVSQLLYNEHSKSNYHYRIAREAKNLFALLSPFDCEDIVGLYLQHELGYRIQPSTCKNSTLAYEYVLIDPNTGETAVAQVKSGNQTLNADDYEDTAKKARVYLFTAAGAYEGRPNPNIVCLTTTNLESFVRKNHNWMPGRIRAWLDLLERL